jgi:hypothetical protein
MSPSGKDGEKDPGISFIRSTLIRTDSNWGWSSFDDVEIIYSILKGD